MFSSKTILIIVNRPIRHMKPYEVVKQKYHNSKAEGSLSQAKTI